MKTGIFLGNMVEVLKAKTYKMIERFKFKFPDPALRKSIRVRSGHRRFNDFHASSFENRIEAGGVFGVAVVQDKSLLHAVLVEPQTYVSRLLTNPLFSGRLIINTKKVRKNFFIKTHSQK